MEGKQFSKGEAIQFGWNTMKANIGFFIWLLILALLIEIVPDLIGDVVVKKFLFIGIIIYIASWVLSMVIQMGLIKIAINFCDNKDVKLTDLFSCFSLFFKYLLGSIIYALILIVGIILLIIPGIVWAIQFQFFSYFIVDKRFGPIKSLEKSSEITMGVKWNLFLFALLLLGINLLGVLCLVVGLFVTIPTTIVAVAFVYRKLLAQTEFGQVSEVLVGEGSRVL